MVNVLKLVFWAILSLKNLLIVVMLMLAFQLRIHELIGLERIMYALGTGTVTLGFSYLELLLMDWLVDVALGKRKE